MGSRMQRHVLGTSQGMQGHVYRQYSGRDAVRIAHMELASPSIGDAVSDLAQSGYREIVIAPYFLSNGRHITQDIPALVAEAQEAHPSVQCRIADPIGVDSLMAKIIEQRVVSAVQQPPSQGSSDPKPATAVTIEKE
ncbi:hypothetical protein WJX73_001818 [Symbiochloris irregularis]|uniref:Sirohydrochlorin cobaltochelatase n=1 Tax=Symbiochloris irregularis TaxID=706552 RepID=A0AAW1NYJ6_9CHLO